VGNGDRPPTRDHRERAGQRRCWTCALSPDGRTLLVGSQEPPKLFAATVWDTTDGKLLARLDDGATAVNGRIETRTPMLEQHIRAHGEHALVTANFALPPALWDPSLAPVRELASGPAFMELNVGGSAGSPCALARSQPRIVAGGDGIASRFNAPIHGGGAVVEAGEQFSIGGVPDVAAKSLGGS